MVFLLFGGVSIPVWDFIENGSVSAHSHKTRMDFGVQNDYYSNSKCKRAKSGLSESNACHVHNRFESQLPVQS